MPKICIQCKSPQIEEVVKDNYRYFYCTPCDTLYERAINPDYGKDITIPSATGELMHMVAGGLIYKDEKFLMLKRRVYAFGYSFPAGHVEYKEKPLDTLRREILEETGLRITGGTLLFKGEIRNHKCRYGADSHYWHFYKCDYVPSDIILNAESESYGWFSYDDAVKLDLVPQARYILENIVKNERKN